MREDPRAVSKGRLEAFSDGVMAIAITLLVLDLRVPAPGSPGGLAASLGREWPAYVSYATSFLTIGIIWVNHHAMLSRLRAVDQGVLFLNLVLLLCIVLLPFTTALMAEYLRESTGETLAAAIYGASLLAMSAAFLVCQRYALFGHEEMVVEGLGREQRSLIFRRSSFGLLPYAAATLLALASPYLTLAICAAIALYYALPSSRGGRAAGIG